jgi:hypothetical protein
MGLEYDILKHFGIGRNSNDTPNLPSGTKVDGSAIATWLATLLAATPALGALTTIGGTAQRGDGGAEEALAVADTGGGVLSWANPEAVAILLTDVVIDVTTKGDGAGTLDVGIAADGTTSDNTIVNGLDTGAGTSLNTAIANLPLKVAVGEFVTGSKASGAMAGIAGTAYIRYMKLPA